MFHVKRRGRRHRDSVERGGRRRWRSMTFHVKHQWTNPPPVSRGTDCLPTTVVAESAPSTRTSADHFQERTAAVWHVQPGGPLRIEIRRRRALWRRMAHSSNDNDVLNVVAAQPATRFTWNDGLTADTTFASSLHGVGFQNPRHDTMSIGTPRSHHRCHEPSLRDVNPMGETFPRWRMTAPPRIEMRFT